MELQAQLKDIMSKQTQLVVIDMGDSNNWSEKNGFPVSSFDSHEIPSFRESELKDIHNLRRIGRWFRDVGEIQLMHAAYRSARTRTRELAGRKGPAVIG